jgi:DNA-binding transcriptional LysR family regulator
MDVELRQLRYFVAVAEQLSFTAAARRLHVSQQALSRVVARLERELGVRLLDRSTRAASLTPAGETLLTAARHSLAAVDNAIAATRRAARQARPVRVDVSSAGLQTGAEILRRIRRDHPHLPVHQVEDGVPRGLSALARRELDLLFGLATHRSPDVVARPIRTEPVQVAMSAAHPLARLPAVPVARLAEAELLLPAEDVAAEWVEFVADFCAEAGVTMRRWPGTTHGSGAAAAILREYDCVTPTVSWADPPGDIVFRPLVQPVPIMTWSMMTLRAPAGDTGVAGVVDSVHALADEREWLSSCAILPVTQDG